MSGSGHALPGTTANNAANSSMRYVVLLRQCPISRLIGSIGFSDSYDIGFCEFCRGVVFAMPDAIFKITVEIVFSLSTQKEMIGMHAKVIVAVMANLATGWNWTVMQLIRNAMRVNFPHLKAETTITITTIDRAYP